MSPAIAEFAVLEAHRLRVLNSLLVAALAKIAEVCNGYDLEAGWACAHARAALKLVPVDDRAYCPRCDAIVHTIDDGATCASCKLVL